ncbi:hypothetical protein MB901379_04136 [Mycobacterium basiliense]|uniref:Uncharacterized protein n=1 Tax=Mycobacterium basiliense TaxID=2094119 RepID=A0A447GJ98_9MYCO|nr:hypothetical protein [Mycobacterium basiliense]VDM90534.1 hypothetical protein MB901379_04136 [Mycobacterium basiliense]
MRTAVVRVNVDPTGVLAAAQLRQGMAALRELIEPIGVGLVESDLEARPAGRREVELLIAGDEVDVASRSAFRLCANAFNTNPMIGVVTFVSRGTDDDAHGVLAAFGLTGEIVREPGAEGFDIVHVTLRADDLDRVPESRIHTALEASLNCEVRIHTE